MSKKRFIVELSEAERDYLNEIAGKGKAAARTILKARILLKADQGPLGEAWTDEKICSTLETNETTVRRVRRQLVEKGVDGVLTRKKRETPPRKPIFDDEAEAQLIALAGSEPPEGYSQWSIRLLAGAVVERKIVERVHHNTIGRVLKKHSEASYE